MSASFDPIAILEALSRHGVRYVVIGGFGAWIHGAPVITADVDIIYEREDDNIERLLRALRELDAHYRHQFGHHLEPRHSDLNATTGGGHHLLHTNAGDFDVLRSASGHAYHDLAPSIQHFEIAGLSTPVLALERIIELKERAGRPKDIAALPLLRATLERLDEE